MSEMDRASALVAVGLSLAATVGLFSLAVLMANGLALP
jgi:hypothetical protein